MSSPFESKTIDDYKFDSSLVIGDFETFIVDVFKLPVSKKVLRILWSFVCCCSLKMAVAATPFWIVGPATVQWVMLSNCQLLECDSF